MFKGLCSTSYNLCSYEHVSIVSEESCPCQQEGLSTVRTENIPTSKYENWRGKTVGVLLLGVRHNLK